MTGNMKFSHFTQQAIALGLIMQLSAAGAESESVFPIAIAYLDRTIPAAILTGMESKKDKIVVMQIDTGSPLNLVYENPKNSGNLNSGIMKIGEKISTRQFLLDTGRRASISLSNNHSSYSEEAAIVSLMEPTNSVAGVLGLSWFQGKFVEISFQEMKMHVFGGGFSLQRNNTAKIEVNENKNKLQTNSRQRIYIKVCRPECEEMIFDSGMTVADIVTFHSSEEFDRITKERKIIHFPGVLGSVICDIPIKISDIIQINNSSMRDLYISDCKFSELDKIIPKQSIFGIRTIIENRGKLTIDGESGIVGIEFTQ